MLLAQSKLLTPPLPALPSPDAPLPLAHRPLLFPQLRRACVRLSSRHRRVGSHGVHGPYLQRNKRNFKTCRRPANQQNKGRRESTHRRADGEHGECPKGHVVVPAGPEVDGAPCLGGRVLPREEAWQQS
jgi:hypothetical protein